MNDDRRLIDQLLHEMFERRARHGSPDGLRDTILASAWVVKPRRGTPHAAMSPLRLLGVAALLAALAGGGFLVAGQQQRENVLLPNASVAPSAAPMVDFIRPFDYRRSDEALMGPPIHEGPMVGFSPGHSTLYPITAGRRLLPGSRGVAIAPISKRVLQRCPDDPELQPAGDVGVVAGFGVGSPTFRTIDGRKAEIVWSMPTMRCVDTGVDVVPNADVLPPSVGSGVMAMYLPSRMFVTTVDGEPIVFQVWASSDDELATWLPDALQFLDGIHFKGDTPP